MRLAGLTAVGARTANYVVMLLLLGVLGLYLSHNFRLPLWEAPDEPMHVAVARDIAAGRLSPLLNSRTMAGEDHQPPLYYDFAAPLVGIADGNLLPHLPLPFERSAAAAAHAARFISSLMALISLTCVYFIIRLIFPGRRFALAVTAFTALTPGFALTSSSSNNDNAAIMFSLLSTLGMVASLTAREHQFRLLGFAGLAGLAAVLSKMTALFVVPMLVVVFLIQAKRYGTPRLYAQSAIAIGALSAIAALGWMQSGPGGSWTRLLVLIQGHSALSPQNFGWVLDGIKSGKLIDVGRSLFTTYWGFAGWQTYTPLDPVLQVALLGFMGLATIGAARFVVADDGLRRMSANSILSIVVLLLGLLELLVMSVFTQLGKPGGTLGGLAHARYLLPAVPVIGMLFFGGLVALVEHPWRTRVAVAALVALAALHVNPTFSGSGQYSGPVAVDGARVPAADAAPIARFANGTSLIAFDLSTLRASPGTTLGLALLWRADGSPIRSEFAAFAHLVAADGTTIAASDGVPTIYRFKPQLWRQGDVVRDYRELTIPPTAAAGSYQIQVGSYSRADGKILAIPVNVAEAPASGQTRFDLAEVRVVPLPASIPLGAWPVGAEFDDGIVLAHAAAGDRLQEGQTVSVDLVWLAKAKPRRDYAVSVQLLAPDGMLVAQQDGPLGRSYHSSLWEPGDTVAETYSLTPSRLPVPGRYTLGVAVYYLPTLDRLPLAMAGSRPPDRLLRLQTIDVP